MEQSETNSIASCAQARNIWRRALFPRQAQSLASRMWTSTLLSIPLNGISGGDLVTFVNFKERYDLDGRIARALSQGQEDVAQSIQRLKRKGGILVADVAGHEFMDAHTGAAAAPGILSGRAI